MTGRTLACSPTSPYVDNQALNVDYVVRFDEHENSYGFGVTACVTLCIVPPQSFPATSRASTVNYNFPTLTGQDLGGWMYINLSSGAQSDYSYSGCKQVLSAQRAGFGTCGEASPGRSGSRTTTQNWVIASMYGSVGPNRLAVDVDGAALGNGCTPEKIVGTSIAPAPQHDGRLVCPSADAKCAPLSQPELKARSGCSVKASALRWARLRMG